ncbi:MAG: sugar phosphate isomerase/epimerase [candidate division Zixibacteria bacterium]|nr:sugar phosphate isomerase/epimerase [candidate division Zixibacteria bacterium]
MKVGIRMTGTLSRMPFEQVCAWMKTHGFDTIDVGKITSEMVKTASKHGVAIGQVDMVSGADLLSDDAETRKKAVKASKAGIDAAVDNGVTNMFYVTPAPGNPAQGRAATFEQWKRTFPAIAEHAEKKGATIALEGWPGGAPHFDRLGSTPEMLRAMFDACPSPAFGINYDPSHLIRLGIDYERVLLEFGARAKHVHAKDTVFDGESLYLYGRQSPTFARPKAFGEDWWRYCIPGEGLADWGRIVKRLEDFGFDGILSVELEDARYWGSWDDEAEGFIRARAHIKRYLR